jgi:hypothetical protein
MQKQLKPKVRKTDGRKVRKAHPVQRREKCILKDAISKSINKNIEKEMAARAVKFNEKFDLIKTDPRAVAKAGGKKPGNKRKN